MAATTTSTTTTTNLSYTAVEEEHAMALMGMQFTVPPIAAEGDEEASIREDRWGLIPLYLRGGKNVEGFGPTLGNALAVLFVARHGLTTTELMHLLKKLREKSDKKLCGAIWRQKGLVRELMEEVDEHSSGYLPINDIYEVISSVDNRLRSSKLDKLVRVSGALDEGSGMVNYNVLVEYCGAMATNGAVMGESLSPKKELDEFSLLDKKTMEEITAISSSSTTTGTGRVGMEGAVLDVLVTLGIMFSQPNQVMVLTLEAETMREVIFHRHVRNNQGLGKWHNALMKYFQAQPSTLRRCEELPWHLHICRRWLSLKDALADLRAFELMYMGKLKKEFFEYWRLLSEGPMYVSEGSEKQLGEVNEQATILHAIDSALALGQQLTDRKACLKGQVAPFDMIECFNKSVEQWRAQARPSTHRLASMLHLIAQFFAEFSEVVKFKHPLPKFLRKPLNWDSMQMIGIDELKYFPSMRQRDKNNTGGSGGSSGTAAANAEVSVCLSAVQSLGKMNKRMFVGVVK